MGLIKEVQNVGASLNKQERARRERERLKILQENYKKEIKESLCAELTALFYKYDIETAREAAILKKDDIIAKLHNEIYNRHYLQKSGNVELVQLPYNNWRFEQKQEKIFLYRDFDIVADLEEYYYKSLKRVLLDFEEVEKVERRQLIEKLKKRFFQAFTLDKQKSIVLLALQQNENIIAIVGDIAQNEKEERFLFQNYDKVLAQVSKLYKGNIAAEKMEKRAEKEREKEKQKRKAANWLLFNYILTDISKSLPKAHNKNKKY